MLCLKEIYVTLCNNTLSNTKYRSFSCGQAVLIVEDAQEIRTPTWLGRCSGM